MKKKQLYYMFALRSEPNVKIIKNGSDELCEFMTDINWKCVGSVELTDEQFDILKYFFE